jgi:uncharacterized protein (DUF1778 family)
MPRMRERLHLRLPKEDATRVRLAAELADVAVSELVRSAAVAAAPRGAPSHAPQHA